jgi:hypothetical protein
VTAKRITRVAPRLSARVSKRLVETCAQVIIAEMLIASD